MSYLVLARKWRPQTFDELIGQEHVSRTLSNAIRSNRVAHAFLFAGVRGVGKTTAARILAKALNCAKGPTPTPCNACVNCQEITAGTAVDVLEIDGASNTGVDDVRQIIENVRYQPAKSRFKIYIIDEVHMLSTSAFNALLKTLEEPPPHVKFIFATTDPHKVPHTIHSRCQRYDFKRIPSRLIVDRLAAVAGREDVTVSEPALFLIAREAEGSMRDAQSLLDQVLAFAGTTVRDEDVISALGLADRKVLYAVADAIVDRNPAQALERLGELHLYGYDMRRFARDLLEHFRDLAVARLLPSVELLPDLAEEERATVQRQAQRMSSEDLDRAFRLLVTTEADVSRVPYPKLLLEMTLIKLATLTPVVPLEDLLERIAELERALGADGGAASGSGGASAAPPRSHAAVRREPRSPAGPQGGAAGKATEAATPIDVPAAASAGWGEFLAFVGKEKVTLLPYLQASQPAHVDGDALALRVPTGHYYDYLVQHTQLVQDLAGRFFGRALRVTVTAVEPVAPSSGPPASDSPAALQAAALGNPVVRAAVEIFGGEVQAVKSRARREGGTE
jgi:DNA polymerase III subunit gamma/tau